MGIKGLPKLIKDQAGKAAVKEYKFSRFRGMTVAVDFSLILHKTVIAMRSSGKDMRNRQGGLTSHLHGLFYKILIFLENEMVPVFVFDGKAPNIKNKTLLKRQQRKSNAQKKLEDMEDSEDEEYIKQFKQTFKPSKEDINEAKILLDIMGVPYIEAPGEADVVCSWLASRHDENGKRFVKGVCSDDSDMLALGSPYLFRSMIKFMSQDYKIEVISLNKTLVGMGLTMDQFTDLCVLLGTDYCDNIRGVGPKTALGYIKKYGSLEKVLAYLKAKDNNQSDDDTSNDGSSDEDDYSKSNVECMIAARNYFRTAVSDLDKSKEMFITDDNLKLRKYQYEELMDFMCVKHDFDVTRIQTGIKRLEEYHKNMGVTKENTKHVHTILQPVSENYIFKALTNDIEFLSSDEETYELPSKSNKSKKDFVVPAKPKN